MTTLQKVGAGIIVLIWIIFLAVTTEIFFLDDYFRKQYPNFFEGAHQGVGLMIILGILFLFILSSIFIMTGPVVKNAIIFLALGVFCPIVVFSFFFAFSAI